MTTSRDIAAELRACEERYRELFERSPQPSCVLDRDTRRLLAVNDAATELYGYDRREMIAMSATDLAVPEARASWSEGITAVGEGEEMEPHWRHCKKNGKVIEVEVIARNLQFDQRPALLIVCSDITERSRAELHTIAFSELGRRLSAVRTPKDAANIVLATAQVLFGWDAAVFELVSSDGETLKTVVCVDTVGGEKCDVTAQSLDGPPGTYVREALQHGARLILRQQPESVPPGMRPFGDKNRPSASLMYAPIRKDREAIGIVSVQSYRANAYAESDLRSFQALADHSASALERIGAEEEVQRLNSELRRNIEELQMVHEHLRLALAAGRMGTWTVGEEGQRRVFLSPELEVIHGLRPGEFSGEWEDLLSLIHPDDRQPMAASVQKALGTQGEYELEFRFLRPQQEPGWLLARGRSYIGPGGKPRRIVGVSIDITARKLAEQEILRLNSELEARVNERTNQLQAINSELEAFCYSVSHDLRAPLRAIRGFSEVLLERYVASLDSRGQEFLRRVCESTKQMDLLIESLLKLSRVGRTEVQRQTVNLTAIAASVFEELRQAEPARMVSFTLAPGLAAQGDERLLRIVLENLLRNAWKFTSKREEAAIEVGFDPAQSAFYVRDNGAGFNMEYATKLFGVFQRLHSVTDFAGTGVGLALVQRVINRHGGKVWAQAAVEQGATFYFSLP